MLNGIERLKDVLKSGRPTELSVDVEYKIKTILKESNQGWITKQIEELIVQHIGVRYHPNHIYRIVRKWGFKQKVPRRIHVNTASGEERINSKKGLPDTCGYPPPPPKRKLCDSIH